MIKILVIRAKVFDWLFHALVAMVSLTIGWAIGQGRFLWLDVLGFVVVLELCLIPPVLGSSFVRGFAFINPNLRLWRGRPTVAPAVGAPIWCETGEMHPGNLSIFARIARLTRGSLHQKGKRISSCELIWNAGGCGEFNGGSASSVPPGSLGLKKAHSLPD
jgi:hypothetical protein